MKSARRQEYERRRAAEPEVLRGVTARDPVVRAHLMEYRHGACTLEEALARAVVALAEKVEMLWVRLEEGQSVEDAYELRCRGH